jgi:hypothetical protein
MAQIILTSNPQTVELDDTNQHTINYADKVPGEKIFQIKVTEGSVAVNASGSVNEDSTVVTPENSPVNIGTKSSSVLLWVEGQTGSDSFIISRL